MYRRYVPWFPIASRLEKLNEFGSPRPNVGEGLGVRGRAHRWMSSQVFRDPWVPESAQDRPAHAIVSRSSTDTGAHGAGSPRSDRIT
jgi:hypothetical protein